MQEREAKIQTYIQQELAAWQKEDYAVLESLYAEWEAYDPTSPRIQEGKRMLGMARQHQIWLTEAQNLAGQADDDGAARKLHAILLERPDHVEASRMFEALRLKKEAREQEKLRKKLAYNKPVSIQFRDVGLKMVFEALAKTTNINFILDKDVQSEQKATLFVQNMLFADALDLLLRTNQLEKKVLSETSAIIYPDDALHQREYKDLTIRTFTLEYADVKQVSTTLRNMLNIKQMETDARLSTIIIKDTPDVLAMVEKFIATQDIADPEVMLEMEVLEVKRSRLQELGVAVPTALNVPVPSTGLTIDALNAVDAKELLITGTPGLRFSASTGDVNLLANPRIRVRNKDVAKIHIGEKVPVFTSNVSATGVSSQNIQYIDAGLKLELEPNISSAGDVNIKINLNVGSIGDQVTSGNGTAFRVGTRTTYTQLRLKDGETQVLAGLIDDQDRKNVNKLPGIGDIPLLGRLFSRQNTDKSKTEIILSITPHIIRAMPKPTANQAEYWMGSDGKTGKSAPTPNFTGGSPFIVPKPKAAAPAPAKEEKPQNMNIPLPAGFSLGGGLNPKPGE